MKQTSALAAIPLLSSVAGLAASDEAWICDIWGVMHNGIVPFLPAAEAARAFRARGGIVCLLTNAPRPRESVIAQIDGIGVPCDAWDAVVTSGDLTCSIITGRADRSLYHLGPARDAAIFEGLDVEFVAAEAARLVVCSGLFDDETETPADYADALARFRANDALMVCANPDIVVERGHTLVYCAGALAEAYEAIGGRVIWAGKPHLPAYDAALAAIERIKGRPVAKDHLLAIGDALRTDIAGAANFGVRSLFIASALHVQGPLDKAKLDALFAGHVVRPVGAMDGLAW